MTSGKQLSELIIPIRSDGGGMPVFFVHSALGSAGYYVNLAREMPRGTRLYGINALGLFGGAEPLDSIEAMGALYARAIRTAHREGPYILAGHSAGAHVAFEMVLQRGPEEIPACIVIDEVAPTFEGGGLDPHLPDEGLIELVATLITIIAMLHLRRPPASVKQMTETLSALSEEGQVGQIGVWLKQLKFLPQNATDETTALFLKMVMAITEAGTKWSPGERKYDGALTVIRTQRPLNPLRAYELWQVNCSRPVEHFVAPGSHTIVMMPPYVKGVAQLVHDAIQRASGNVAAKSA